MDNCVPIYKRRAENEGGFIVSKKVFNRTIKMDNSWVVPYNPYLSRKYDCHINVEKVVSIRSLKYAFKYVFKGPDMVLVKLVEDQVAKNQLDNYFR